MALVLPPSFLQNVPQASGHTARGDRLTIGSSFTPGTSPLGARSGILPGPPNGSGEVTLLNATTVRVQAFRAVVQGTQDSKQGQYVITNDSAADLPVGAQASGVVRRDLIAAYVRDSAYPPTTQDDWVLTVIPGAAVASNPQLPATPINALLLGEIAVAATGGTNQITPYRPRTAAAGGIVAVPASDTTPGVHDGQTRYVVPDGTSGTFGVQSWDSALNDWVPGVSIPRASVTGSGTQAVGSAAYSAVLLSVVDALSSGVFLFSAASGRLGVTKPGYVQISGGVNFTALNAGRRFASIAKNGTVINRSQGLVYVGSGNNIAVPTATIIVPMAVGDYLNLMGYQDSGSQINFDRTQCGLDAVYLGR